MSLFIFILVSIGVCFVGSMAVTGWLIRKTRMIERWNRAGEQFAQWEMWNKALECFQRAIVLDRAHARSHYNLGHVLYHGKKVFDSAASEFRTAISLESGMAEAHYALGHLLFHHNKDIDNARQSLNRAIELDHSLAAAYHTLGFIEITRENWHKAMEMFGKAIAADGSYDAAYRDMAIACIYQGRTMEAIGHAQQYARLQPESAVARNNLGNIYGAAGKRQEALEQFQISRNLEPGNWITHFWLGCLYLQMKEHTKAVVSFHDALERRQGIALAHYNLAMCYEALHRKDLAKKYIEQAIEFNPALGEGLV
jgi:tetratricopeptide (TPR) repeat protein